MNAKISVFANFVEAIIYLLLYNLHDCAFKEITQKLFEICLTPWKNNLRYQKQSSWGVL